MSYSQALDELIDLIRYVSSEAGGQELHELAGCHDSATKMRTRLRGALDTAAPYYWSPDLSELLALVSQEMPPWTLREAAVPSDAGFFWFARALEVPCPGGSQDHCTDHLVGLLWQRRTSLCEGEGCSERCDHEPYETIWLWPLLSNATRAKGAFVACTPWVVGQTRDDAISIASDLKLRSASMSDAFRVAIYGIFAAALAFIEQRILVPNATRPERPARKRAATVWNEGRPVRIVELRREQARPDHRSDAAPAEWSHRWIVSGHWRQQFYPSTGEHRPIWILPHVKGPEDKPLKAPAERIFAVVR